MRICNIIYAVFTAIIFILTLWMFIKIYKALHRMDQSHKETPRQKKETSDTKMVFMILCCFVVSYFPVILTDLCIKHVTSKKFTDSETPDWYSNLENSSRLFVFF